MSSIKKFSPLLGTAALLFSLVGIKPVQAVQVNFDESVAPPAVGTEINDQWEADYGVKFSTTNPGDNPLWLFNSDCNGGKQGTGLPDCTGKDPDLATGEAFNSPSQGNVLIIQERPNSNDPDDDRRGGKFEFNFTDEGGVDFEEVAIIDLEESVIPKFTFYFNDDTSQVYDQNDAGVVATLVNPDRANDTGKFKNQNFFRTYNFTALNLAAVKQVDVELPGVSGAIAYLQYERLQDEPADIPEPASGLALLGIGVLGVVSRRRK